MPMPQAPTAGPERSQPTWYRMRDNAARQVAADQQAQASAQSWGAKPPVTAATAVTDRPVQERAANVWPATDLSMQGRAAPDWPVTDKSVNDRSVTGQVMGGKDAKSKTLPWSDNPDPTTRPVEIKPEAGTVATGGSPPDRRDQPVGLGGKLGDGSTIGAKDPNGGASAGPESDKSSGKAPSNPAGSGAPGIIGQIIDGHGGMKPPVIWSPFGDKGGAKEQDADAEKGQKSGRRQTQADGRTPAEALLGILDSIKGGIGGGTRLGQFGKTNQFVKPDRVGRMDPFIKPIQVGRQDPVGKQGKFVIPGQNGKGDKTSKTELTLTGVTTKPWPTAKDGSPTSTVAILTPFLSGTKGGLRVIKDVTQSTTKDVTQSSTKDVNQSTTNDIGIKPNVIGAKLGPMLVGPGSAPFDDTALGFDTVKMKPLDASHEGENPDVAAKDGRQKARPSVNLHLPGGTYGGGKSQTETEPSVGRQGEKADAKSSSEVIPPHGEAIPTHGEAIPTKPWISAGTEETLDHSQTVASIPSIAPLEGMTRPRPAKAIDESESTVQMEAPERSPAKRAHAHPDAAGSADVKDQIDKWGIKTNSEKSDDTAGGAKGARPNQWSYSPTSRRGRGVADRPVDAPVAEKGSEGADGQSNDDIHITSTELSRDSLQKEDQFTYVVQQGDTIESVAVVVLQDSALASLLFSLNRRYVLPEEQYGVHPLMVGVVIQLPSPTEILKYRQILS